VEPHQAVVERIAPSSGVIMLIGGLDSGKTTLGRSLAQTALSAGRQVAYLDADIGQKTVGPPGTVGLKLIRTPEDLELERFSRPDALSFVGATSPQGQLLPLVVGAGRLLAAARELGADTVVADTSGLVSGVYGQMLKFHKVEALQPDVVIGLQRGAELDPLLGILQRFFAADVIALAVHPEVVPTSVDERAQKREIALQAYFAEPLQRWRVKPTVFMPALPSMFDQAALDRLVVGLSDGKGDTIGLGYLEHSSDDDVLRLVSPVPDAPKALKLGSFRLEPDHRVRRVDLRNLFGTD
jgi:polynucleotide 5'-kinase involved in rRNA processing